LTTHTIDNLVFSPNPTLERLQMMRHILACQLDTAQMMAPHVPFGADMILELAIDGMLQYYFWQANHHCPCDAELLTALDGLDCDLSQLARRFYAEADFGARWSLAEQIAQATIESCECIEDDTLALAG
jgi:hypothetical protein